jgi:hypothetical protein
MKYVIGIGTGRCGTKSLAALLNAQEDAFVTHERARETATHRPDLDELGRALAHVQGRSLVGDVAMWWLQSVPLFLRSWERLFMNEHGENLWEMEAGGDADFFPPMNGETIAESAARYWDHYYQSVERLQVAYPERVAVFNMSALNRRKGRKRIVEHAGVEPTDLSKVHENAGPPKKEYA